MFKKFISLLLIMFMSSFISLPSFANEVSDKDFYDTTVEAEFVTDLNVNESAKRQIVQFKSTEDFQDKYGHKIPKGTIFTGKIKSFKKSRWAYRRAKARIILTEMILPDGKKYHIKGRTKRAVLKGSMPLNIVKGVLATPPAICVCVAGGAVMLVESITIVGLVLVPATGGLVAAAIGKITNGINCKKHEGDDIKLKIRTMPDSLIEKNDNSNIPETEKEYSSDDDKDLDSGEEE